MTSIAPRLELRQGQSLVMTQQLQQSIKLLQLSSLELTEFIEQELEKNPLLATEDGESVSDSEEIAPDSTEEVSAANEESEDPITQISVSDETTDWSDSSNDDVVEQGSYEGGGDLLTYKNYASGDDETGFESTLVSEVSLREHLQAQLNLEMIDQAQRMVGQHLIDLVNEDGYIAEDTKHIIELLGCDAELIEKTFSLLQTFDPVGVCARNLAECLAIQLSEKDRLDPAMKALLQHLDCVAKGDVEKLSQFCGVDTQDIADMCAEIRELNPRPGNGFIHEPVESVIPDVFLRPTKQGAWQVELNSNTLPRVLINRRYYAQLNTRTRDKAEKKYLSDQLAQANWLVKALDQRAHTILKVSTEIVAQQDNFFRHGIKYLRPLTLKEVAAAIDLHESTVSRVTTSKYMATPRGVYELKYFFNAAIQNADGGEGYSNKSVQHLIKELIEAEKEPGVLSDDAIAIELKSRGIDIARRTVAKYRELMKIASSSTRKRNRK